MIYNTTAAIGGSVGATLATHWLNNIYSLQCLDGGSLKTALRAVTKDATLLVKGLPETLLLRSFSQGGAIAIQGYLQNTRKVNNIVACTVGGTWDAFIMMLIDLNNISKITAGKGLIEDPSVLRRGIRVFPMMLSRDVPNLVLGRIYGTKFASFVTGKREEELTTLDKFLGAYVLVGGFQIYASPLTAATLKMIDCPKTTAREAFHAVFVTERSQLMGRIASRALLAAGRNCIAFTLTDLLLGLNKSPDFAYDDMS